MNEGNCIFERKNDSYHVKNEKNRSIGDIRLVEISGVKNYRFFPLDLAAEQGLSPLVMGEIAGFANGLLAGREMPETASAHHV
jgi:hypothetical protein